MEFFKKLVQFIKDVASDDRIPSRDKKVILALLALVLSPIDFIPDWIPIFGVIDDVVIIAIVCDYFFEILDQNILLSHFPWDMKWYARVRRLSRLVSRLTPKLVQQTIWKFEGSPYKD